MYNYSYIITIIYFGGKTVLFRFDENLKQWEYKYNTI